MGGLTRLDEGMWHQGRGYRTPPICNITASDAAMNVPPHAHPTASTAHKGDSRW